MTIPQYDVNPLMMPMNFKDGGMASSVQKVQSQGRLNDSMLVHMNPQEVAGLQALARQNGTSLTINPQTGLPEAFNLRSLIPMAAGAALTPVLGPAAPFVVGGIGALATGSLGQGIMMGLGAAGGANLAGSAANLAAPAAMATEAATMAAPAAIGGAAGAEVAAQQAAAELAAQQAAAQAATTQAAAAANIAPPVDISGNILGIDEMASLTGGQGVSQVAGLPPTGINKFFTPDPNVTYQNIGSGLKNAFSSGESAMDFLGQNKMNLAMSAAPSLIPETPEEAERKRAMIRPYEYQVDNLSGADVDPLGTETERFRGRFVEKEPYYAAKGGLMSFAEGGDTSGDSSGDSISITPAEARVYSQIAAVQRAAGIPALDVGRIQTMDMGSPNFYAPRPAVPYNPAPFPSTIEKKYNIYRPVAEDSPSYRDIKKKKGEEEVISEQTSETGLKRGGSVRGGRKPISRDDPFYEFGLDMYKIAQEQFADGGMTGYSYDPTTNSYRMASGGLTSLKAGGLREGAFIVPADVISHLGNGSSEAGMKIVQERLKGRPIKGPGDGMSDSIPTTIAGKQPARVANEEAEIPPEVVAALGGGSLERGAKKLYEMMDKIRQDRTGKKKQAPAVKAEKYMPA
jgi:hypothetical protein